MGKQREAPPNRGLSAWAQADQRTQGRHFPSLRILFLMETRKRDSRAYPTSDASWRVLPCRTRRSPFNLALGRKGPIWTVYWGEFCWREKPLALGGVSRRPKCPGRGTSWPEWEGAEPSPQNGPSHLLPPCTCPDGTCRRGPGPACSSALVPLPPPPAHPPQAPSHGVNTFPSHPGRPQSQETRLTISLVELHFSARPVARSATCNQGGREV